MIDQDLVQELGPLALAWARETEALILNRGSVLSANAMADATRAGVQEPSRIRVLVVDRIPLPEDARLAQASRRAHIITEASRAVTIGHGIMLRVECWGDRELLLHQLVHVAQCERCGGLEAFVQQYLTDRQACPEFTIGGLEDEARRVARDLAQS